MFVCPNCRERLIKCQNFAGLHWVCDKCQGRAVSINVLRKLIGEQIVYRIWVPSRDLLPGVKPCPMCGRQMVAHEVNRAMGTDELDVCRSCHFVWFDPLEFDSFPRIAQPKTLESKLPQEAREKIAIMEA